MKRILGVVSEGRIDEVRVLSDVEYEEYKKAVARLLRFSSDQQLFMIARLNYEDFLRLLRQYLGEFAQNASLDWPRVERTILNINRHLFNYLSAARMFLDHSETNLKERHGKDSRKVKSFKIACSNAYDSSFSYRFLYRLRNYAQHCGTPLGGVDLRSRLAGPGPNDIESSMTITFSRDELLNRYKLWGKRLTQEIQQLPPKFEITSHVSEMMRCLDEIDMLLLEDDLPELVQNATHVQKLVNEAKSVTGSPCILWFRDIIRTDEGKINRVDLSFEWIPTHLIEMIMYVRNLKETKASY